MVEAENLKEYFERSRRWEQDELRAAQRSKRFAWFVAGIASIGMIASVSAVAALVPLQKIEPFVVRVDTATGITEAAQLLSDAPKTLTDAQARYFIAKYVTARESYSRFTVQDNYRVVNTMSTAPVQEAYARWISGNNPDSPQKLLGPQGTVRIEIRSVQMVREGLASVRYVQIAEYQGANPKSQHYIATIAYEVLPEERLTWQQRLINPIAFAVTEYRTDPEVVDP
ncbi:MULTISPECIES: virB8 family protein [Agrobacterium]|uniref:Type IV secretion system protein virB8 n=1 Tax=Agrobacterium larrymoorei TaxID=160699 RepID=A0ABX8TDS5_9HYPH|nr:VirB8/TrbF family protein [Agrobacterium larrymoorei]NSZ10058.1 virB8 family protein [Agrobacterium tumefaciens]QYA10860.1 virB8 family protein [Agrobacterium larrymoorei]